MKNKILALAVFFLCSMGIQAQIDRSTQPEAGPAPKINLDKPDTFTLSNGLKVMVCLLYTSPSPRDRTRSRMPSSA